MPNTEREYRNNVFCLLCREKKYLLTIYNAVNGTSYDDEAKLDVVTLKGAICLRIKDDAAFIIDSRLNIYEQQSTANPNIPLRDLYYIVEELKGIAPPSMLYRKNLIKIPEPKFVMFYNGTEEQPERQIYRLSDMYLPEKEGKPDLELKVTVININEGCSENFLDKCSVLKDYMRFVKKVRRKTEAGRKIEDAVKQAVDECIAENILTDFFREHKEEVVEMGIFEFDEEEYEKTIREESREEGRTEGIEALILDNLEEGRPKEAIIGKLIRRFHLEENTAKGYYDKYSVMDVSH